LYIIIILIWLNSIEYCVKILQNYKDSCIDLDFICLLLYFAFIILDFAYITITNLNLIFAFIIKLKNINAFFYFATFHLRTNFNKMQNNIPSIFIFYFKFIITFRPNSNLNLIFALIIKLKKIHTFFYFATFLL